MKRIVASCLLLCIYIISKFRDSININYRCGRNARFYKKIKVGFDRSDYQYSRLN